MERANYTSRFGISRSNNLPNRGSSRLRTVAPRFALKIRKNRRMEGLWKEGSCPMGKVQWL